MYYLGVDLGTSSVKVLLVDTLGNVIGEASEDYPLLRPYDNWSEQNPSDWWESTLKACKTLLNGIDKSLVKAISFGGQMHGLVALDKNNNVLRPAILWNDGRTEKQTKFLNEVIGKDKLVSLTGNFAFAGFTLPKILWMKENEPELYKQINMILLPKDYLTFKFSGKYATDYSDASGMLLLDVEHKCWSKEMTEISGLSLQNLPQLYESYDVVGTILEEVANELGLNKDVKIVAGAGDNAAAAVGTGCVNNGQCNVSLGTSGTIFTSSSTYVYDNEMPLHSFDHANGEYHLMGCILTAASANKWWIKDILDSDFVKEISLIKEENLGENKVLFAPYLSGERCPHNDVNVRGAFINLEATTSRTSISQAIMEGVSFALLDCLNIMRNKGLTINEVTLCGGGAKNLIWAKMIANIFNTKVNFVKTEQGPGYGAAILAMVGDGVFKDVKEACKNIVSITSSILPNEEIVQKYAAKYAYFTKLYKYLKEFE